MAKRFRKVFIVCENNQTFGYFTSMTVYKTREHAEEMCKRQQAKAKEEAIKLWNANQPLPKFKVHGFYLVHEDMFKS